MPWERGMGETEICEHFRAVSELLARQASRGTAPWMRSFDGLERPLPVSYSTGYHVRDTACVWLAALAAERGYRDPRWCTFETVRQRGGYVIRGERATLALVWHRSGGPSSSPVAQPYKVFNAQQCGGLVEWEPESGAPIWQEDRARRILRGSGARFKPSRDGRASYDVRTDRIELPPERSFPDSDTYLRTALHELGHWTGHPARLNRATLLRGVAEGHGSSEYAREELRAEIASMIAGDRLEFGHDTERHAPYRDRWIGILREDPMEIDRASHEAQRICDCVIALERERPRQWQDTPGGARDENRGRESPGPSR